MHEHPTRDGALRVPARKMSAAECLDQAKRVQYRAEQWPEAADRRADIEEARAWRALAEIRGLERLAALVAA